MATIKTWQERCTDGAHQFSSFSEARDEEIADLRAALAKATVVPSDVGVFYVAFLATGAGTIYHTSRLMRRKQDALVCAGVWESGRHRSNDHQVGVLALSAKEKNHDAN